MISDTLKIIFSETTWPLALALAWVTGELLHRRLKIPRVSTYCFIGFILGAAQTGFLPQPVGRQILLPADIAFGLILFELGYRINLHWLRTNPWLGITSITESTCSFIAVFIIARLSEIPLAPALLLAALAIPTSPAVVLRVANDLRSSGQVTERMLHLAAFNCVLAVVVFRIASGCLTISSSGNILHALWNSLMVLFVSAGIGVFFGVAVPAILRKSGDINRNATIAFAIAVILLTVLTRTLDLSPLLATLAFGAVARNRRIALSQAERNFGSLGDLMTLYLFVFVAAILDWRKASLGVGMGLAIIAVRIMTKTAITTLFARLSGITWRKGALTGLTLTPLSVFAVLLPEQSRYFELNLPNEMAPITAIILLLGIIGPIVTQFSLIRAEEADDETEGC